MPVRVNGRYTGRSPRHTERQPSVPISCGASSSSWHGTQVAGLPLWTAQDRSLTDTDLVVWFTVGFHHIVRTEDLPQMPAHEASFSIRPADVFPNNPFLDLLPR